MSPRRAFLAAALALPALLAAQGCGRRADVRAPDGAPAGWGEEKTYPPVRDEDKGGG